MKTIPLLLFILQFCLSALGAGKNFQPRVAMTNSLAIPLLVNQGFEGTGFENATTESWVQNSGAPIEDPDDTFFHTAGSQSLSVLGAGGICRVYWLGGSTNKSEIYGKCTFTTSITNANNAFIFGGTNTAQLGFVRVASTARLQIFDDTGGASGTTADAMAPNTTYYVRWHMNTLAGSGDVEFNTADSFSGNGTKFASYTGGGTTKLMNSHTFECPVAAASNHVDQVRIGTSGYPP